MTKWSQLGFLAAFPLPLIGCGTSDQLQRQVARLEKQLVAVRADADRMEERLAQIELSNRRADAVRTDTRSREGATDRVERPRLKVIHVTPDAPSGDEAADTSVPTDSSVKRPVIRGTGDRVIKMFDVDSAAKRSGERPIAATGSSTGS